MMTCAGTICFVLPFLAAGAYVAIMLAVVGVPQLLTHYFDHRSHQRDRQEDLAAAAERRREDLAIAEERRREDLAAAEQQRRVEEERRREDLAAAEQQRRAEEERRRAEAERRREDLAAAEKQRQEEAERRREDLAAAEQQRREDAERHREDVDAADRRHQETMALLGVTLNSVTSLVAAVVENRAPPPAAGPEQTAAIADLQQSMVELTQMVSEMRMQMRNGSGHDNGNGGLNDPTAPAPSQ